MTDYSIFKSILLLQKTIKNVHYMRFVNARGPLLSALFLISLTSISYSLSLFFPIFITVFNFSMIICFFGFIVLCAMTTTLNPDNCCIYFSDAQFYEKVRKILELDQNEFNIVFDALTSPEINPEQTFPELNQFNDCIEKAITHYWQSISNQQSIQNIVEGLRDDKKLFLDNEENKQLTKLVNLYNHQVDKLSRNKQQISHRLKKAGIDIPDDKHLPAKNQKIKITE